MPQNMFSDCLRLCYEAYIGFEKLAVGNNPDEPLNWTSQLITNRKLAFPLVASWTVSNKVYTVKLPANWFPARSVGFGYDAEEVSGVKGDAKFWWGNCAAYAHKYPDKESLAVFAYWHIGYLTGMANSYEGTGKIALMDVMLNALKPTKYNLSTCVRAVPLENVNYDLAQVKALITGILPMHTRYIGNMIKAGKSNRKTLEIKDTRSTKPVASKKPRAKKTVATKPTEEVTV